MRICVIGAGSIGGLLAARLAKAGEDVTVIARGAHLDAIRRDGLTLVEDGQEPLVARVKASHSIAEAGRQDLVVLGMKAHQVADVVRELPALFDDATTVLTAQNGIPWWYFHGVGGRFEGTRLESVEPGGEIWRRIGPERALGSVVWQAAEIEAPGIIAHHYGERMPIGEPTGEKTERAARLSRLLTSAGIKSPVRPDLRGEIWLKLWGNLSFNPVSVLTLGTLQDLATDSGTRRVIRTMMEEARAVAEKLGISFAVDADERMDMAAKVGAHRTSMLQDVEAGRPTELDALLGVVIELGRIVEIGTPSLQLVYDLCKFRSRQP